MYQQTLLEAVSALIEDRPAQLCACCDPITSADAAADILASGECIFDYAHTCKGGNVDWHYADIDWDEDSFFVNSWIGALPDCCEGMQAAKRLIRDTSFGEKVDALLEKQCLEAMHDEERQMRNRGFRPYRW